MHSHVLSLVLREAFTLSLSVNSPRCIHWLLWGQRLRLCALQFAMQIHAVQILNDGHQGCNWRLLLLLLRLIHLSLCWL